MAVSREVEQVIKLAVLVGAVVAFFVLFVEYILPALADALKSGIKGAGKNAADSVNQGIADAAHAVGSVGQAAVDKLQVDWAQ